MALTVTNKLSTPYRIVGNQKETVRDVTFDESYAEGGESLTASDLGLSRVDHATCTIQEIGGEVNVASAAYDDEESLIHLFDETPAEVAARRDVSRIVVRVVARGY